MFHFLHFHIFNFVHIQPHTPAHGHAGSPAQPTPLLRRSSAARCGSVEHRRAALGPFGCWLSCRIVFLRGSLFVCLFVCWGLFCVAMWEVCKEGDEQKERARTWVGAHRCAPGLGTEREYYR